MRTPVGLDQHVVDVAGQHVAFFGDAGLQKAAMTQMAREAQIALSVAQDQIESGFVEGVGTQAAGGEFLIDEGF